MNMTIVHINVGLGGGGAEHMILELAKRSQSKGYNTLIISLTGNDLIKQKFIDNNLEIHFLNVRGLSSIKRELRKLHSILKDHKKVVLHCHMFHALVMGLLYKITHKNSPIVFTLHNILVEEIYRRFILFFTKPFRKIDINFSNDSNKWYLKPIEVIPNGVDFKKFHFPENRIIKDKKPFIFLYLGRIEEQKNPLILPEIVLNIINNFKGSFVINIAGDGDQKAKLEQLITQNNLEAYIKILGFRQDTLKLLQESHCLILPSLWEGLPITLIEASATKLPIITSPVGSITSFFNPSNSYISSPQDFDKHMIHVMRNYDEATSKANKLYNDIKTIFDIDSVYSKHESIYVKAL